MINLFCAFLQDPFSPLYFVSLMCLTNRRVDLGRVDDGADSQFVCCWGKIIFPLSSVYSPLLPSVRSSQSNKISFLSGAAEDVTFLVEEDWRKDVRGGGEILFMRNLLSNLFACHSFRLIPFECRARPNRTVFEYFADFFDTLRGLHG